MSKGLDKVKAVIDKAHRYGATKTELQQEATQTAIGYLNTLDASIHWFCNDDTRYVVLEAMALFSFPGTDALKWLQGAFERALNRCHQCAEKYQMAAKVELRQLTSETYGIKGDIVDQFFESIDAWDRARLTQQFKTSCRRAAETGLALSDQKGPGFEVATLCALFECLWYPTLCETSDFMQAFQTVFLGIQEKGKLLRVPGSVLPAMFTFSFSPDKRLRDWSRKCFEKAKVQVTAAQFKAAGRQETIKSCLRFRQGLTLASPFWIGMQTILCHTDPNAVVSELRDADLNLMDFICGEICTESNNLQAITRSLDTLLRALGVHLWASCPMPVQDFGPKLINNPKFKHTLAHPEVLSTPTSNNDVLAEYLQWLSPYTMSQFGSNRYRVANEILQLLIGEKSDTLPNVSQIACAEQGLRLLVSLLQELISTTDKDSKRSFQLELRNLVDIFASKIAKYRFGNTLALSEWSAVRSLAADVLVLVLQVDCDILWSDYVSLSTTEYWGQREHKYQLPDCSIIWSLFSEHTKEANIDVLQRYLEVVGRELSLIDAIEIQSKMSNEFKTALQIFNRGLNQNMMSLCSIVRAVGGTWSANQLKAFLKRPSTNQGVISLMFSPNHEAYAEALNFLKEAYEVDGRIEALRSSFSSNFTSTVQGFVSILHNWSAEGIFKSATRVVRTASNVLDILFSSRNGLLVVNEVIDVPAQLFQKLWQAYWRMLETIYTKALPWAERFDKADLIEFMRDVLECSDLLLGFYSVFEKGSLGIKASQPNEIPPEKQKPMQEVLLNECLKAIKSLTSWLRLSDTELLQSCVNLVTNILTRLAQADIRISDETEFIFDRLIINSKKRKNCLTEKQRTEIYIALCQHTETPEDPNDVQVFDAESFHVKTGVISRPSSAEHEQSQSASVRKAIAPREKHRLPNVSTKSSVRPSKPLPVLHSTMTPAERADFLRKRSGELPSFLQTKKPLAKNASAGAVRKEESSASESESGDDIEGLFSSADRSPAKTKADKRQTRPLESAGIQLVRRDPRQERDRIQKNIRARTNPDLTDLHMKILAWDPTHEGGYPPGQTEQDYAKLVNSYQTADRYRNAVEPLFLLETWQHVVSSYENIKEADKFEMILQTRSAVDNFVDLVATISATDWKKNIITDPDLLMLSTSTSFKRREGDTSEYCLAKVQSIFKKKDIVEVGLRSVPSAGMVKHLRPSVQLYAVKLSGLTPIHREYATLKALPYYDLCDEIVLGRPTKGLSSHQTEINKLIKAYGVNEPQAKAIDAALQNTGFTLIQGPPGTGKTKTILGMVGAFLSSSRVQGTAISLPGQQQQAKKAEVKKKKILLCAPSNAAVDEIVLRLKSGINTNQGEKYIPKIVRMGMSDAINVNVQDVTLDALLDDMLNRADDKMTGSHSNDPTALREKLNETLKARDEQRSLLNKARADNTDASAIEAEIRKLNERKSKLGEQLDELRDKQSQKARAKDIERKRFQSQILADADVICATLSGSGHELMASIAVDFETVIIDEACQTTELSALIPLKYGCTRCVMVGDPSQLPPTVLSTEAVKFAYNESLFVRMQRNNSNAVRLLAIQYRMHSSISRFPSNQFYAGSLLDGPEVDQHTARAWHNSTIFGTYRFFDIRGREEQSNKFSVYNVAEARAALAIVQRLKEDFFDVDFDGRIGIITPYKEQHNQIRRLFQQHYGQNILSMIDFNTIDGFQGQEKDIIIFSCVRANEKRGIGFLSDIRRMNVGLTRAKSSVFILGHSEALKSNTTWRALIEDAQARNLFTPVGPGTFSSKTRIQSKSPHSKRSTALLDEPKQKEVSPSRAIKAEIQTERPNAIFDDTKAPPQQRSALFEVAKKPTNLLAKQPLEKKEVTSHDAAPACKTATSNTQNAPVNDTNGHQQEDVPVKASKPNIPTKRKAEPSLFIKRKRPAK